MSEGKATECESLINGCRFASEENATIDELAIDGLTSSVVDMLTPKSKDVYTQYVKDWNDNILVDGYFRKNMRNQVLPPGVNRIIAAYYLKTYSVRNLGDKLISLKTLCMKLPFGSFEIPMQKLCIL